MPYSIELHFDSNSNKIIKNIWDTLQKECGQNLLIENQFPPHLTLSLYEDSSDFSILKNIIERSKEKFEKFEILFSSFGFFKNDKEASIFLCPSANKDINNLYDCIYRQSIGSAISMYDDYTPPNWTPHCTVSMATAHKDLPMCMYTLLKIELPINLTVNDICLEEF